MNILGADATVADNAAKVVHTPCLVECEDGFTRNDLIARVAEHTEKLLVVKLTVG